MSNKNTQNINMNRSDELIKDISYSKDSHLILKNREKHILTELNREIRNTNNLNKI